VDPLAHAAKRSDDPAWSLIPRSGRSSMRQEIRADQMFRRAANFQFLAHRKPEGSINATGARW
jgi:hypothetical protein